MGNYQGKKETYARQLCSPLGERMDRGCFLFLGPSGEKTSVINRGRGDWKGRKSTKGENGTRDDARRWWKKRGATIGVTADKQARFQNILPARHARTEGGMRVFESLPPPWKRASSLDKRMAGAANYPRIFRLVSRPYGDPVKYGQSRKAGEMRSIAIRIRITVRGILASKSFYPLTAIQFESALSILKMQAEFLQDGCYEALYT